VLDQHAKLDLYSADSLTQQSMGRHVVPILLLNGEATNTYFIVFGFMLICVLY